MSDFNEAVQVLIKDEGGEYVPNDRGRGPSKWGVTLKTAQEIHPSWVAEDIENLTRDGAISFYHDWLWNPAHIFLIEDQSVATKLFDIAANIGPQTCIKILQHAVNADPVDGILGPHTAGLVNAMAPAQVLTAFKEAGKVHYDKVVAANPEDAVDYNGWIARLNA